MKIKESIKKISTMKKTNCNCELCKSACSYKPGWFTPKQIPTLLKYFNVSTVRELVEKKKVVIDWYEDTPKNILVLAPNIEENNEIYYPGDPRGACVFFKNGSCSIYKTRPTECSAYIHTEKQDEIEKRKNKIVNEWRNTDILEEFRNEIDMDVMDMDVFEPDSLFSFFRLY